MSSPKHPKGEENVPSDPKKYPSVNPDAEVFDPNPGNMVEPEGMDGPSNVDVPADPASRTAKIAAEENPSNKKLDDGAGQSEINKAGFSERPDGSDNPARVQPADQTTAGDVKPAPKREKTLGQEMDEADKATKRK
jgi:hypothetical protein